MYIKFRDSNFSRSERVKDFKVKVVNILLHLSIEVMLQCTI